MANDDDDVSFAERYQLERQEAWAALRPPGPRPASTVIVWEIVACYEVYGLEEAAAVNWGTCAG